MNVFLTPAGIKTAEDDMVSPIGSSVDDMPHARNLHSHEDKMLNSINKIDVPKERYKQAVDAVENLSDILFCGRSDVYRRKDKAVEHLTILLYGY